MGDYHEELQANKLDNLEVEKYLETHNLPETYND